MTDAKFERRMSDLEKEVLSLRRKVEELTGDQPWWDRIAGTFEKDPIYERAMKLGRMYRKSQQSEDSRPSTR